MSDKPSIAIIGPGVVGTTLGILAARAGYEVVAVAGRSDRHARAAAERIGPAIRATTAVEAARAAKLVLLTVPDDAVEPLCQELARAGVPGPGAVLAHCSGALSSEVLTPARRLGAAVGSMHPLQTFPNVAAGLERAPGAFFFCEGDERAVEALEALARAIGGKAVRITSTDKLLYHAAAVMACNYLTALLDAALTVAGHAGIPPEQALEALQPLVRATIDNVFAAGPASALTGPIARGDCRLIDRQYRRLAQADARLGELYAAVGLWTVELALVKGSISPQQAERLRKILRHRPS